jgi:hypothetical protein
MLYWNIEWSGRAPTPVEARDGMKWFRSNIRPGSRLALCTLAIQFLLSFGHFHGSYAQAAPALPDATRSELHQTLPCAAAHSAALDRASHEDASRPVRSKTSSDDRSGGRPADDCVICAVLALANALVVATPPYLPGPQAAAFLYLTSEAGFVDLNSARVAFQPRAPPIS